MTRIRRNGPDYYSEQNCDLSEFVNLTSRSTHSDDVSFASEIQHNIPIYDVPELSNELIGDKRRELLGEWARALFYGPGVLVLRKAYTDTAPIDAASEVYGEIIAREKSQNGSGADHFAKAGSNDRIWNSLQKLCEEAPDIYVSYFACPAIDGVCEAWLGPNYQMTAQVNVVHPGGEAQQAHRDYHLGFQTAEISASYPAHVHELSPLMTLQGGIAHCDMSVESGPTKLLPFSQLYKPGYAAWRRADFRAYFEDSYVQLPLAKGDAIFFNPALFHAAGANRTEDVSRMVNLLQISSAFGRAMETIDRDKMCRLAFPVIQSMFSDGTLDESRLDAVIAATAEGYSFPTNLDRDPPIGGLAPKTQAAVLKDAVTQGWETERLEDELNALAARQLP